MHIACGWHIGCGLCRPKRLIVFKLGFGTLRILVSMSLNVTHKLILVGVGPKLKKAFSNFPKCGSFALDRSSHCSAKTVIRLVLMG